MYLLGHTDPRFTMRVYEQVFDAGPQTVAQLETVLGCTLEEAFAIYSGRQVSGLKPDSAQKTPAARSTARAQARGTPLRRAVSGEAAEGIRTLDLRSSSVTGLKRCCNAGLCRCVPVRLWLLQAAETEDAYVQVSDDPLVGNEVAGYRIESLLGRGGMSVVYLAEDLRLKRKVALKLLAASLAGDVSFRDRFLRESELAASIDHPNIVPIFEAGSTGDLLFIAMRYVDGQDLKERLRLGRLDPGDAAGILAQVASALDAAHARGLVHRDVKPSNVLLDRGARPDGSDHVYLADFGLTKRISEETGGAEDGRLMGTVHYVAPEQIAGGQIDGRADVYSLGCVLFECLVGQPPFRRDSEMAVLFAHLQEEPPAPSAQRPGLPAALDAVIARALAKEPEERHPSCRELARATLAVAVDEASRRLVDVASRAAAGRSDLSEVEAELAGKVIDLQLVREQERAISGAATPARVSAEGICPFKGLASFEPVDADYFFGRERLVAELVARLVGATFLGIVGPSGSGKSSVLRAGLLPALAAGVLPGSASWRRLLVRPGERPLDELRRVLVTGAGDPLAEALDALPDGERLLVVVDQLEELFTACSSDGERAAFAGILARAAADPKGRAVVVVALRADFYGRFAAHPSLAELLGANHVLVASMQASELRRVVELPAGRVGLRVEPELADALVDDVEGEPGALPLLSTALLELWQRRHDNALTLATYRESGGVHGAIARLAEGTYARIPDGRKPTLRAIMLRLVGEGEGDAAVRRRAPLAELDLERNEDVAEVLAALADTRLVTVGEGYAEVAHEALLREWPRLREWIEEDAEGRRLRRHITQAATEWDAAGRDQGELYRGARLAAALDWTGSHALDLNELEREFVTESRQFSEQETKRARRTNRRLRVLLAGIAVLLAAALAGGVFALVQRGEARDAETAQLAQRLGAQALVDDDLDRSLLLARQAVAIDDSPQTRSYLLAGLLRRPAVKGVMHGQGDFLRAVAASPDGRTLVVADLDTGLLFFDPRTYERIGRPLRTANMVDSVAYSPDGETIALGGLGFLRLIDAHSRRELAAARVSNRDLPGDVDTVDRIAFTRDGSQLVAVVSAGEARQDWISVHDGRTLAATGAPIRPEGFSGGFVGSYYQAAGFALTPDGRSAIVASGNDELAWWDIRERKQTRRVKIASGRDALAVSPDGRTVAVGIDGGLQLVDARSGSIRTADGAPGGAPSWLLFSPDGGTVVATSLDGTVTLWDAGSLTLRETLRGHSRAVQQPVFSSDGETLYTVSHDGTAIAWDIVGDRGLGRRFKFTHDPDADPEGLDGHPGAFSPDGRLIALGLSGEGIRLWDSERLTPVGRPLLETGGEVWALEFTPDGSALAAVTDNGKATVWDVEDRSLLWGPDTVAAGAVTGLSISPDGTRLATASIGGVSLRKLVNGDLLPAIGEGVPAGDVAFSPDGSTLAFVHDQGGTAEIWDVARRARIARLPVGGDSGYYAIAFSPDGESVATGPLADPYVRIWDVDTGDLIRKLDQGSAGALTLDFSPDGRILAVSGFEPVASLWDVESGARIGPTLTAGSRRAKIDLSPDGRRLLLTHADGRGAVWDVDPESWARRACRLANRTLTPNEWDEFLPGRPYQPACAD
jgi:WD40 repeat protein